MTDPPEPTHDPTLDAIMSERRQLINLAYRLLGSLTEAEDAVQETYTRWYAMSQHQQDAIVSPGAWLTKVAGRVCLDLLGSARARRERYVGNWIPEPIPERRDWRGESVGAATLDPADRVTLHESIAMAFLVVLESMTPAERVAFVLHDVFGYPFDDIGEIVARTPAACRQLASSARRRVRASRIAVPAPGREDLVRQFKRAWEAKDITALVGLLDPAATVIADGGGLVSAHIGPIEGGEQVARAAIDMIMVERTVNGQPGLVAQQHGVTGAVSRSPSSGCGSHTSGLSGTPRSFERGRRTEDAGPAIVRTPAREGEAMHIAGERRAAVVTRAPDDGAIAGHAGSGVWPWACAADAQEPRRSEPPLAQELHDAVGHHVSLIVVQAQVALHVLANDPGPVSEALEAVLSSSRSLLRELRGVLGALDAVDGPGHGRLGMSDLPKLIDQHRAAGQAVTVRTLGAVRELPIAVDLAAYRIIQECLTNVRRHAPGARTQLIVRFRPSAVALSVENSAPGVQVADRAQSTGRGLRGTADRAAAVGGLCTAARRRDGGFAVHAHLPVGQSDTAQLPESLAAARWPLGWQCDEPPSESLRASPRRCR